jgi:hypothetical protein
LLALGFEGEEGWRVAARIKVVLLSAGAGRRQGAAPGLRKVWKRLLRRSQLDDRRKRLSKLIPADSA